MGAVDLKRPTQLAVSVLVALLVSVAGAGTAFAQDTDEGTGQNSFQSYYDDCRDGESDGAIVDGGFLGGTGAAKWLRDSAHSGGLREALTSPVNAGINIACNGAGAVKFPTDAIEAATSGFWGDPIGDFVKSLLEGNAQALGLIMTMWIKESPFSGASMQSSIMGVFNMTLWAQGLLLIVSLLVAGTRMAVARNKGLGDGFEDVGQTMFNFILAGAALPTVILSLHLATDALSTQWLEDGLGADPAATINAVTLVDDQTDLGPAAVLILVVFALLGALAQLVALVVREGLLVVVVGLLPLAAAAWSLNTGKQAFRSMIGFVVAALLFKPIATLLYLAAFWLASGSEEPSVMEAVSSMLLLAAAGLVLPALMRAVAPAVSASVAGGSAAGIGAAAAGATGAFAGAAGAMAGSAQQSFAGGGSGGSGSGSGSGDAATGAAYLGSHSSGGSSPGASATPSGGGSPSGGGGSPAASGQSPGGNSGAGSRVSGALAGASRGAGAVAGLAATGAGAVATAAHGTARATQTTEQMLDGALAAHPTPHHYR